MVVYSWPRVKYQNFKKKSKILFFSNLFLFSKFYEHQFPRCLTFYSVDFSYQYIKNTQLWREKVSSRFLFAKTLKILFSFWIDTSLAKIPKGQDSGSEEDYTIFETFLGERMMSWQSEFKTNLIVFDMFFSYFEGHIFKNNPEKQRFWLEQKYEVAKYLDLTHNFDRSMKL